MSVTTALPFPALGQPHGGVGAPAFALQGSRLDAAHTLQQQDHQQDQQGRAEVGAPQCVSALSGTKRQREAESSPESRVALAATEGRQGGGADSEDRQSGGDAEDSSSGDIIRGSRRSCRKRRRKTAKVVKPKKPAKTPPTQPKPAAKAGSGAENSSEDWVRIKGTESDSRFGSFEHLQPHLRKSDTGTFICGTCGMEERVRKEADGFFLERRKECGCRKGDIPCTEKGCLRTFNNTANLQRHVNSYHTPESAERRKRLFEKSLKHQCGICDFFTSRYAVFRRHELYAHPVSKADEVLDGGPLANTSPESPEKNKGPDLSKSLGSRESVICACGFQAAGDEAMNRHLENAPVRDVGSAGSECRRLTCYSPSRAFAMPSLSSIGRYPNGIPPVGPSFTVADADQPVSCVCGWWGLSSFAYHFHIDHCAHVGLQQLKDRGMVAGGGAAVPQEGVAGGVGVAGGGDHQMEAEEARCLIHVQPRGMHFHGKAREEWRKRTVLSSVPGGGGGAAVGGGAAAGSCSSGNSCNNLDSDTDTDWVALPTSGMTSLSRIDRADQMSRIKIDSVFKRRTLADVVGGGISESFQDVPRTRGPGANACGKRGPFV